MVTINIEEMVQRGVHLGHPTSRWNPKMAPYIYTKRNGVYIIDLMKTVEQLKSVSNILKNLSAQGKTFLFVGTKRQASENISRVAFECNSFYVNQRWLGGMLTNWKTIKKSLHTLQSFTEKEGLEKENERNSSLHTRAKQKVHDIALPLQSNERFKRVTKKEVTQFKKRKDRLEKYLGGLKGMTNLPDVVIIVGQSEEMNAVLEAQKLGITTISVLDTDCNPTLSDFFVVANDDSIKSLEFILNIFLQAILEGKEHQKSLTLH